MMEELLCSVYNSLTVEPHSAGDELRTPNHEFPFPSSPRLPKSQTMLSIHLVLLDFDSWRTSLAVLYPSHVGYANRAPVCHLADWRLPFEFGMQCTSPTRSIRTVDYLSSGNLAHRQALRLDRFLLLM
jgi:hypothetical protein